MNIFAFTPEPARAPRFLDDRRLQKMTIETGQILSAVHKEFSPPYFLFSIEKEPIPYWNKFYDFPSSVRLHPCTYWAMASKRNYTWLATYYQAAVDELRFRGIQADKAAGRLKLFSNVPEMLPDIPYLTPFHLAFGISTNPERLDFWTNWKTQIYVQGMTESIKVQLSCFAYVDYYKNFKFDSRCRFTNRPGILIYWQEFKPEILPDGTERL